MPGHLRAAYRDGRFDAMLEDSDRQVIPTSWVMAAEERWRKDGARDQLMTAMALDPAGGGKDAAALSRRYGPWFDEVLTEQGAQTADGSLMAAWVVRYRRHNAGVVIDTGGGYGGAPMLRLKDNDIQAQGFDGAAKSPAMSRDGTLRFANKRAEAYWKFMEELDPDVPGGSVIALPPDPELRADLCAPTWEITRNGILLESKDSIKERLGPVAEQRGCRGHVLDGGRARRGPGGEPGKVRHPGRQAEDQHGPRSAARPAAIEGEFEHGPVQAQGAVDTDASRHANRERRRRAGGEEARDGPASRALGPGSRRSSRSRTKATNWGAKRWRSSCMASNPESR